MKTEKTNEGKESGTEQLGVEKKPLKRATIYGSSLLRSLQTQERQQLAEKSKQLQQEKKKVEQQEKKQVEQQQQQSRASPGKTPTKVRIGQSKSPVKRTLQNVTPAKVQQTPRQPVSQAKINQSPVGGTGAQLCLKFVKATGPDGKPGLTAILGASPNPPAGVSVLQNQTPRAVAPRMQTPIQQQTKRVMQQSGPPKAALTSAKQRSPAQGLPTQVPFPRKPGQDETQAAVDALLASTSNTSNTTSPTAPAHTEPRIGNWKNKPRAVKQQDLAKTEKLLNALRTLMSQQKAQVDKQQSTSESQVSRGSPDKSIPQTSVQSQPSLQNRQPEGSTTVPSEMTINSQPATTSAAQLQEPSQAGPSSIKSEVVTTNQPSQMETEVEELPYHPRVLPHQLPPDGDRLGLDQSALKRKQKQQGHKSRKRVKKIRQVSPDEAMQYLESLSQPQSHVASAQRIEANEWNNMIKNIDIFMFPVYRCKLCPNYYTTVKTTMVEHMKNVHRWPKAEQDDLSRVTQAGGNEERVDDHVQSRVKNIQNIFERKLRSQSNGDGDGNGDLDSVHSQSSFVDIPFNSGSPQAEGEQSVSVSRAGDNDEDDRDDDDYDPGEGGFEDVDDDSDDEHDDDDGKETAGSVKEIENLAGGVRKSPRLVKLSSTPMIRKYHHRRTRPISPQMGKNHKKKNVDKVLEKITGDKKKQEITNGNKKNQETAGDNERDQMESKKNQTKNPRVHLTRTPIMKSLEEAITIHEDNEESKVEKSVEVDKGEEMKRGRYYKESYIEDEDEEEDDEVQEVDEENSEEEIDTRDLNEVRPKYFLPEKKHPLAPSPPCPNKRARLKNKQKHYFKPGNQHYTKRAGYKSAKDGNQAKETGEGDGTEGVGLIKVPPAERPKTRSLTRSTGGLDCDSNMMEVAQGKNRIRISRYEAWKKIGLDPNSEPPWPCTHPGCGYYFASLASVVAHHVWKHDTFGDRTQRILARGLGEKYSLFEKREKRAIEGAKIQLDDENADGESSVIKSRRKKKPVKRLSSVLIGKNKQFGSKKDLKNVSKLKKKKYRCKYCRRFFATQIHLRGHMRRMHKTQWMKDNNLTQEDLDEITKNAEENDETCANISLLATVADKLEDRVNLYCKQCNFKAISERTLASHMDQAHPQYIRSIYSDSEGDDNDEDKPTPDVTPSSRPVRNCRRRPLPKLLQKEKKLDKVIPLCDDDDKSEDDDGGNDGGDEAPRSGFSLQCIECNYISVADKNFVNHMKKVHNQEVVLNYQCDQCDFKGTAREMFLHKKTHVPTVVCDMCGKTFKGDKRLKMHQAYRCGKEKPPQKKKATVHVKRTCQICHKVCNNMGSYKYHMAGHRADQLGETFGCNFCDKKFTRKQSVRVHMVVAHTEGKYQCEHCSFKAVYQSKLKHHVFDKHGIGGEELPDIKCSFEGCSFTTKSRKKFVYHKKKHDMTRFKYWCDGCQQPIRTLTCLARHQVLHRDGVNKYKCKECGYQASNSNTLSSHKRSKHADLNKVIICDLCGDSFHKRAALIYHKKTKHTQGNSAKCKYCDQTFKFSVQVTKHMKEEHQSLVEAEEAALMEEAKKIINAVPKTRAKSSGPKKKKKRKPKPPTGRKVGRPKVPLTPEIITKREELKRARNKRKYENRKAKLKRLGLKRKKYPKRKGQAARTSTQVRRRRESEVSSTLSTVASNDDYSDEEVAAAAQQLESIAQAFTAQPQKMSPYRSARAEFPVHVEPTQDAYGQLTALNSEFQAGASTSAGTLHIHPPVTSQEVVVPTDIVVGGSAEHQSEVQVSTTQRLVQAPMPGQMVSGVRPGEQPVSYLEVTTVHSDGRRNVELWPVWKDP